MKPFAKQRLGREQSSSGNIAYVVEQNKPVPARRKIMKRISFLLFVVFAWFVSTSRLRAQSIITFDAPGAGTCGPGCGQPGGQGTLPFDISPGDTILGVYIDSSFVTHGFLRSPGGTFTTIDAPNAGSSAGQGTFAFSLNQAGAVAGYYLDASNVFHGFLRSPGGTPFLEIGDRSRPARRHLSQSPICA
jgi:hypothetical protein